MDVTFSETIEETFKTTFLENAPLYRAAKTIRFPCEDKISTVLYRGSLSEQVRTVEEISDYHLFRQSFSVDESQIREKFQEFAKEAGTVVDGLIRLENSRTTDHDVRNTTGLRVIDIFQHADGRRNLQLMVSQPPANFNGPDGGLPPWIAYRFYFAAANVRTEYKSKP